MVLQELLIYLSSLAIIPAFVVGVLYYKYLSEPLRLVFIYICFSITVEIALWGTYLLGMRNHFVVNLSIPIESMLLALTFYKVFQQQALKNIVIGIMVLILSIAVFSHLRNFENINQFSALGNSISNIFLVIIVFIYFFSILQSVDTPKISSNPMYWISSGILIYNAGTLFVFIMSSVIMFNKSLVFRNLWSIYYALLLVFRLFLVLGLWFSKTPKQLNQLSK